MQVPAHMLSAKEAADVLGVKLRRVYQLKDRLGGAHIDGQGYYFSRERVQAFKSRREASLDPRTGRVVEGVMASQVFTALQQGKTPIEIVIELSMPPDVVRVLAENHADLSGGLMLTKIHLDAIAKLPGIVSWAAPTPDDFVNMLRDTVVGVPCAKCQKRPAQVCMACKAR